MLLPRPVAARPGGSDKQVQVNNAGAFGGTSAFTADTATGNVSIVTSSGVSFAISDAVRISTTLVDSPVLDVTLGGYSAGDNYGWVARTDGGDPLWGIYRDAGGVFGVRFGWDTTCQSYTKSSLIIDNEFAGLILKDSGGHYWQIGVSVLGVLTTTDLGTSLP